MNHVSITARFPMRTFLGHEPDGSPSAFPDTSRLFSALIHAASKGSLAEQRGGDLRMRADVAEVLTWMESRPPRFLAHPKSCPVAAPGQVRAQSYRAQGDFDDKKAARKALKPQSDAVACDGVWGWAWSEQPPHEFVEIVRALCEDVSCLGEADSPVIMEVAHFEPTHELDAEAGGWPQPGGISVRTPTAGRLAALERDYAKARPTKSPTIAADKPSWSRHASSHSPTRQSEIPLIYRAIAAPEPSFPWSEGIALAVDGPIDPNERVPWCVALHRALVAQLGEEASPMLTGKHPPEATMPANRVAIQFLTAAEWSHVAQTPGSAPHGAFVVLVPPDASVDDQTQVLRAITSVKSIYRRNRPTRRFTARMELDVAHFWQPAQAGLRRLWVPLPGLVAESRPPRGEKWTYADAALLSLGYVFRDHLPELLGPRRQTRTVASVKQHGARVHQAKLIPDSRTDLYAHKPISGMVVQPYSAVIELGDLLPETALCAIGQARHLGGGLLVPLDVPDTVASILTGSRHGT